MWVLGRTCRHMPPCGVLGPRPACDDEAVDGSGVFWDDDEPTQAAGSDTVEAGPGDGSVDASAIARAEALGGTSCCVQ